MTRTAGSMTSSTTHGTKRFIPIPRYSKNSFFILHILSDLTDMRSHTGSPIPFTVFSVILHAFSVSSDGALYMISIIYMMDIMYKAPSDDTLKACRITENTVKGIGEPVCERISVRSESMCRMKKLFFEYRGIGMNRFVPWVVELVILPAVLVMLYRKYGPGLEFGGKALYFFLLLLYFLFV